MTRPETPLRHKCMLNTDEIIEVYYDEATAKHLGWRPLNVSVRSGGKDRRWFNPKNIQRDINTYPHPFITLSEAMERGWNKTLIKRHIQDNMHITKPLEILNRVWKVYVNPDKVKLRHFEVFSHHQLYKRHKVSNPMPYILWVLYGGYEDFEQYILNNWDTEVFFAHAQNSQKLQFIYP